MSNGAEKRRSFRLTQSVLLQYEIIDEDEFQNGLEMWKIQPGAPPSLRWNVLDLDSQLDEVLLRVKIESPAAGNALELLNHKLNTILESLPEFRQSKEALAGRSAQICELSTEGMSFGVNETLPPQTKIVLRFLLMPDNRFFEVFCRVVRTIDSEDFDACPYNHRIAVEFDRMNVAEREILIQHMLSKQSETLRLRRKQADA